ncbi:hypothetical protein I7I48_10591 [Histoplasma ohiense]|nr:hypothetical protein I7I48_10591 [Histoplasma ohiense (nom. inval.)]
MMFIFSVIQIIFVLVMQEILAKTIPLYNIKHTTDNNNNNDNIVYNRQISTASKDSTDQIISSLSTTLSLSNFSMLNLNQNSKKSISTSDSPLNNRFVHCEDLWCKYNEECLILHCGPCIAALDEAHKVCMNIFLN